MHFYDFFELCIKEKSSFTPKIAFQMIWSRMHKPFEELNLINYWSIIDIIDRIIQITDTSRGRIRSWLEMSKISNRKLTSNGKRPLCTVILLDTTSGRPYHFSRVTDRNFSLRKLIQRETSS